MTQTSASDRKDIRKAEKKARLDESLRFEFVRSMMSGPAGRAYAYNQLERCHLFRSSFDRDPIQAAFNEGERNSGLQLLNDILSTVPDQYITMIREANERRNSNDRDTNNPNDGSAAAEQSGSADRGRIAEIPSDYSFHGNDDADDEGDPIEA